MRGKKKRMTSLPLSEMDSTQIYQPELLFLLASLCFRAPPRQCQRHIGRPLICVHRASSRRGARAQKKKKECLSIHNYLDNRTIDILASIDRCMPVHTSALGLLFLCIRDIRESTRTRDIRHKEAVVMCTRSESFVTCNTSMVVDVGMLEWEPDSTT